MISQRRVAVVSAFVAGGVLTGAGVYLGLVTAAVPVDLGVGRRTRALGPLTVRRITAPREVVYGVIVAPYADRTTRALREKVRVLERGTGMVLAAHYTPIRGRLHTTTVETVRFARPERVDFRLVRGPAPYVAESFELDEDGDGTVLVYTGELGTRSVGPGPALGRPRRRQVGGHREDVARRDPGRGRTAPPPVGLTDRPHRNRRHRPDPRPGSVLR